jgi:hypothetical protein
VHWSFGLNIECITSVQQVKQNDSKMWVLINSTKKPFIFQFIAKKKKNNNNNNNNNNIGSGFRRVGLNGYPLKQTGRGSKRFFGAGL